MATQTTKPAFNWFGVIVSIPALACVGFLAFTAVDLKQHELAVVFTLVGFAMAYGSTKIN